MKGNPKEVSPRRALAEIAAAIPAEVHPNIIIIGSLAAGYGLFREADGFGVRTKDVDCVLSPHLSAVEKGRAVAETLLVPAGGPTRKAITRYQGRSTHLRTSYLRSGYIRREAETGSSSFSPSQRRRTRRSVFGHR